MIEIREEIQFLVVSETQWELQRQTDKYLQYMSLYIYCELQIKGDKEWNTPRDTWK